MHILINGSFWAQPEVGIGQYLHGLVRWLPRVAPQHRYTLLQPARHADGPALPAGVTRLPVRTPFDTRNENLAKLWFEQISVPTMAHWLANVGLHNASQTDSRVILHVPYFAPPLSCPVTVVTTVGDIIPLLLPEYRGGLRVRAYMRLMSHAVRYTTHILTFSQHSLCDIAAYFNIPSQRISSIYLAADERYQPAGDATAVHQVAKQYGLTDPFIYYVGGLDARKNVALLLQACALLHKRAPALRFNVAIAGRPLGSDGRLFPDLDALIAKLQIGDIVRRIHVPHADGPQLYQACTLFAFPSRYEGFGLPPLEAMACGAPVVTSNASSIPEVVGDAALCIPPDDVSGWATALAQVLGDQSLRASLRIRGLERARQFSWRRVAEETVQAYEAADRKRA